MEKDLYTVCVCSVGS